MMSSDQKKAPAESMSGETDWNETPREMMSYHRHFILTYLIFRQATGRGGTE
jgi:hypothetical protein